MVRGERDSINGLLAEFCGIACHWHESVLRVLPTTVACLLLLFSIIWFFSSFFISIPVEAHWWTSHDEVLQTPPPTNGAILCLFLFLEHHETAASRCGILPLTSSLASGSQTSKPAYRSQWHHQASRFRSSSRFWYSCPHIHPRGKIQEKKIARPMNDENIVPNMCIYPCESGGKQLKFIVIYT